MPEFTLLTLLLQALWRGYQKNMAPRYSFRSSSFVVLKGITVIVCVALFLLNSWGIFVQFQNNLTTLKTSKEEVISYSPPTFVLCHRKAFQNPYKKLLSLSDYLENTYDVSESIIRLGNHVFSKEDIVKNKSYTELYFLDKKDRWESWDIYSLYRGRCRGLRYRGEVKPITSQIAIGLNNSREYLFWTLPRGYEIFFYHAYWPAGYPEMTEIDSKETLYTGIKLDEVVSQTSNDITPCLENQESREIGEFQN